MTGGSGVLGAGDTAAYFACIAFAGSQLKALKGSPANTDADIPRNLAPWSEFLIEAVPELGISGAFNGDPDCNGPHWR
jgi:hypothetical protein